MKKVMLVTTLILPIVCYAFTPFKACDAFSDEMKACYERDGFVVIEGFLTKEQCAQLQHEAQNIVTNFDIHKHCSVISASSCEESQISKDDYFFDSSDKVSCFLEPDALVDGKLVVEKNRAINKIGHALHDKNPVFERITFCQRIVQYAHDVGLIDPIVVQSMFIFKYAHIGSVVTPHQDATFLYTDPISVVGFWVAVDEARIDNACLWVIPGSHTQALRTRFVCDENKKLSFIDGSLKDYKEPDKAYVPLEVPQGSLVIFDGKLIHKSEPNRSSHDRNAYTFHVVSGTTHYTADNWLQRDDFPRLVVH